MMTGHPGIFAGGDMVPAERNVTVAIGHGKKAARTSTPGCAASLCRRRRSTRSPLREAQHLVLRRRAEDRAPDARHHPPQSTFEEVQGGLDEGNALFEARRCLSPAATASNATTATASAPTTP
jgi:hypothetical protein